MTTVQSLWKKCLFRFDWVLALLATVAAISLHVIFLTHAGGLWRDEAGVVRLATLPTFGETWSYLGHESCPLLFPTVIRVWSAIGFGGTDFGLRVYGFVVGLLLLGAVWFSSWKLTRTVPLISLALLAVNVAVVRWGDSLRAYGIGSVFMLLTVAFMWRFVASPTRNRWFAAALTALLSVQCLFQNTFLLLAVCIAGCAVCWRRKDKKNIAAVFAIGLLAAVSLLPYLKIIREAKDWSVLSQTGFLPDVVWQNLSTALAQAVPWTKWLWFGPALLAICCWAKALGGGQSSKKNIETPAAFYAATALTAGAIIFFVYLRLAALYTEVWYFLPLMTFAAVCIDATLAKWFLRFQIWRQVFLILLVGVSFSKVFELAQCRQTNMDLIAAELCNRAGPDDLIIVYPWYCGISFDRYFNGKTPWTTIPDLGDHRFHRYDLFKKKMQMENPLQPVLDKIASTLQSGNNIWIAGWLPLDKTPPQDLGPAPNKTSGWLDKPYSQAWGKTAGYFIAAHARRIEVVSAPTSDCIFEDSPLLMVSGWREPPQLKGMR
jgi:hypothetical protein